jgi:RNA polymerase sigma-70 factor (ECF subfamily)
MRSNESKRIIKSKEELLPTRVSLLDRLRDVTDGAGWKEFFDTYWKLIYGFAIQSGLTQTEAEDVVQETMISVAKALPEFRYDRGQGTFKAWLLQITRRRIADCFRKRPRLLMQISPKRNAGDPETSTIERVPEDQLPDRIWEEEWRKNLMDAALENVKRRIKPKQYQIFDLYVVKEWPLDDILRTLRVTRMQVYLAKHRISAQVRREVVRLQRQDDISGRQLKH